MKIERDGSDLILTGEDGTRTVKHYRTEAVAAGAETAMKEALEVGDGITFGQLVDVWDECYAVRRLKKSSIVAYKSVIKFHLLPAFEGMSLKDITETVVDRWMRCALLTRRGRTVTAWLVKLQAIMGRAKDWGFIEKNPVIGIDGVFLGEPPENLPPQ